MEFRRIGDLKVSVVGVGCKNFGRRISADRTREVVGAALDCGINYFDTAETYGDGHSEEFLGQALLGRRDDVVIATKWGSKQTGSAPQPGTRGAVRAALEGSLTRLGTDYVDHYQLHFPDPNTPIAETLGALAELRTEGLIREIGCSNFDAEQLDESARAAIHNEVPSFASVQNHYSLLTRTAETGGVIDACVRHGIALVPFYPLEAGLLTGKYEMGKSPPDDSRFTGGNWAERFLDDERLSQVARLTEWATERDRSLLELAMSWLVSNPVVATVICGATSADQVHANVGAVGWAITASERSELNDLVDDE